MSGTSNYAEMEKRRSEQVDAFVADGAAIAIVQMDPHAREDLITYIQALNAAQVADDADEQNYLLAAIREVFALKDWGEGGDLESWSEGIKSSPTGKAAGESLAGETSRFFAAYQACKAKSGLGTIRQVAAAARLSPTTVQAIEKQRVKPQYRTILALAKAFGVRPEVLSGR